MFERFDREVGRDVQTGFGIGVSMRRSTVRAEQATTNATTPTRVTRTRTRQLTRNISHSPPAFASVSNFLSFS
jgi:hypothetical protein